MNKNLIKIELTKMVNEEVVSGEKVTKNAQKISKKSNDAYYKDVEDKMGKYDKNLKTKDKDGIDPAKHNYEGSEKEYHDEMEILNGQEMIQYDREPSDKFKDRATKAITGDSTMGNKTYTGKENGNTESVWGASDDKFGEKLVSRVKSSKKKRDAATPTFNQFGDDIEVTKGKPKGVNRKVATESIKRITFKKPFDGVGNAIKLIPEAFKVNGKEFELTDGNEAYRIKWQGSLTEGMANILKASDKNMVNEDYAKIKHLMGYNSESTLGTPSANDRVNENNQLKVGISQGFVDEDDETETVSQYVDRLNKLGELPPPMYEVGDRVLMEMGDGTQEKLTISKVSYYKSPKGKFSYSYHAKEYKDKMMFLEDMIIRELDIEDQTIEN